MSHRLSTQMSSTVSSSQSSSFVGNSFSVQARDINRSFVGSLAFLVYDILLTFDQEVEFIYERNWSLFKWLYFYVRYIPLALQISLLLVGSEITPRFSFTESDCYKWEIYQGLLLIAIMAPVDYILVARIYALYHTQPSIQILVSISYIAGITFMAIGLGLSLPDVTYDAICHTVAVPRTLLFYSGGEVALQTLLFVLTVHKFVQALRAGQSFSTGPIAKLIMRDGTWAFFLLFGLVGFQAIIFLSDEDGGVVFGWTLSCFSFCGYRILLNLSRFPCSRLNSRRISSHSRVTFTTIISQWTESITPPFSNWEGDVEHDARRDHELELGIIIPNSTLQGNQSFQTTL